jgi:hypothetical protein
MLKIWDLGLIDELGARRVGKKALKKTHFSLKFVDNII